MTGQGARAPLHLYHRTTAANAARIRATGRWLSRENTRAVYLSTRSDGHASGYGDTVVHVIVPEEWCELDDEFPDGEQHYRVHVDKLARARIVDP